MAWINPFDSEMAWVVPVFAWIYISYNDSSFLSYLMLILGILALSLKKSMDLLVKIKGFSNTSLNKTIFEFGKGKWLLEISIFLYAIYSFLKMINYARNDILAYVIFWLSLISIIYGVVAVISLCIRFKILKPFYEIGLIIGDALFRKK